MSDEREHDARLVMEIVQKGVKLGTAWAMFQATHSEEVKEAIAEGCTHAKGLFQALNEFEVVLVHFMTESGVCSEVMKDIPQIFKDALFEKIGRKTQ